MKIKGNVITYYYYLEIFDHMAMTPERTPEIKESWSAHPPPPPLLHSISSDDDRNSDEYHYLRIRTDTRTFIFREKDKDYLSLWHDALKATQVRNDQNTNGKSSELSSPDRDDSVAGCQCLDIFSGVLDVDADLC